MRGYGPIDMLWLDGGWVRPRNGCDLGVTDIVAAAREIQPNIISVDRGQNDENMNIRTPEQTVPEAPLGYPWESCITMSGGWGYHYDDVYKSPRELVHMLVDVVAKGGNLALNVGPTPDGRLPVPAVERMRALGAWLAKNGKAIYGTRPVAPYRVRNWAYTRGKDGTRYAIRLWSDGENDKTLSIRGDSSLGGARSFRHLSSGVVCPVRHFENATLDEVGVVFEFPEGLERDRYADAFAIEEGASGAGQEE